MNVALYFSKKNVQRLTPKSTAAMAGMGAIMHTLEAADRADREHLDEVV